MIKFWNEAIADTKKKKLIGGLTLRELKLSHLLTGIAQRPDLTGKTINNYASVIRKALDLAVVDKIIHENPAHKMQSAKHQKLPPDPFSREEVEAIIADMAKHYHEPIYNMVEAWFFTGLSTSEVLGQRWPNVDLFSKHLTVVEAVVMGKQKNCTKTSVVRSVQLNGRALGAINR